MPILLSGRRSAKPTAGPVTVSAPPTQVDTSVGSILLSDCGEARKLAGAGLAVTRSEPTGRRPRTVYAITQAGRDAVAAWLALPAAGPSLEFEAMVKVAFADLGSRNDLVERLTEIAEEAELKLGVGAVIAEQYLAGHGAFPDRLHVSGLAWRFMHDHFQMIRDWARWALDGVSTWPDTQHPPGGPLTAFARYQPAPPESPSSDESIS